MGATSVDKVCLTCGKSLCIGDTYMAGLHPHQFELTHCCKAYVAYKGEAMTKEFKAFDEDVKEMKARGSRVLNILRESSLNLVGGSVGEHTPEYELVVALMDALPKDKLLDILLDYQEK